MEPACSTYYVADSTMRSVDRLFAGSLCNFGHSPNFLCEWVYDFFIGGPNEVYKKLPDKLLGCKSELGEIYEKVYIHFFFFLRTLIKECRKILIQLQGTLMQI